MKIIRVYEKEKRKKIWNRNVGCFTCLIEVDTKTTYTQAPPMYVEHNAAFTNIRLKLAKGLMVFGPQRNAASAVSAYVILGVFVRLHRIWDERTNMWTQCAHIKPIIIVPIPPNITPPFLIAFGMARIPVPRDDFNR